MADDEVVSRRDLAAMWEEHDPTPPTLVEKVLVALVLENLDVDYELLSLVDDDSELEDVSGSDNSSVITFSRGAFSLLLRVSRRGRHCRVDGLVSPAQPMRLTIIQQDKSWETGIDARGRFEVARLPVGSTRFWLRYDRPEDGSDGTLATPTFDL